MKQMRMEKDEADTVYSNSNSNSDSNSLEINILSISNLRIQVSRILIQMQMPIGFNRLVHWIHCPVVGLMRKALRGLSPFRNQILLFFSSMGIYIYTYI